MKVQTIPSQIDSSLQQLLDLHSELADLADVMREHELQAQKVALEAKDDAGKLRFTNDKARDIATHELLKVNEAYQQTRKRKRQLSNEASRCEATIERLRRKYKIALIDYEATQLGRRVVA